MTSDLIDATRGQIIKNIQTPNFLKTYFNQEINDYLIKENKMEESTYGNYEID